MTEPEHIWYGTFFDHVRCDALTRKGEQCRLVPVWVERKSGQRFCPQHAEIRFNELREVNHG